MDNQSDRDLLIRIDEQVKGLRGGFEAERLAVNVRATKHEFDLDKIRADVDSLRTSRTQFYAVAATISFIISLVIRVFWK
jgi:hypothetical protein